MIFYLKLLILVWFICVELGFYMICFVLCIFVYLNLTGASGLGGVKRCENECCVFMAL